MTKFNWEKWPLLVGAAVAIFFSVRLYQDGKDENLVAAAVLLTMSSILMGAFIVIAVLDWARSEDRKRNRVRTKRHNVRARRFKGPSDKEMPPS